ncbi:hypothetical protein HanPI659440_Chr01g0022551 [Helianthus annuus]|nr:hypothetical protein HanPI659440_Chr01g0022551 [Helianthus annuus]
MSLWVLAGNLLHYVVQQGFSQGLTPYPYLSCRMLLPTSSHCLSSLSLDALCSCTHHYLQSAKHVKILNRNILAKRGSNGLKDA